MQAFHLVCHECPEEAMLNDRDVAEERRERHVGSTDHKVSLAFVS